MGNGVNEGVMLFAPTNFTNEKTGVQRNARDQHGETDDTDQKEQAGAPVHDNPADVQGDCDRDQERAEQACEHNRAPTCPDRNHRP